MENVGRVSQSDGTQYRPFLLSRLTFRYFSIFLPLSLVHKLDFSFFIYPVLFSSTFLLRLYVILRLHICRVVFSYVSCFSSILSFVSSATHFSCAEPPSTLVPSRSEIGLGAGVDIGSICDLPRATITCNTVGLSGTRWGVLSVRKKNITVTHPSSPAPLPYEEHDLSPLSYHG